MTRGAEIELGEAGAAFVAGRLGDGRTLSRLLLAELGTSLEVRAWWPEGAPRDEATELRWGGLPDGAGRGQLAWVTGLVVAHLAGPGSVAVFENNLAHPGDAWVGRLAGPVWAHEDEVYHALGAGSDRPAVEAALRDAERPWLVGALAGGGAPQPTGPREIDGAALVAVATGCTAVVMSAYDEEGYVVARRR